MIISHQHRYLFVEVPHTGTTAISRELRELYGGERILHKHANYTEFRRQATRDEKKYFVFAGVRNPLDLVVTEFFKYRTNHKQAFTSLTTRGKWVSDEHIERFQFAEQSSDFPAYLKQFFRSTYNNWFLIGHRRFDDVMRFENLAADFETVLQRLQLTLERPLPVQNKSARPDGFESLYTPDVIPLAVRVFGPFMREWGYSFPEDWNVGRIPLSSRVGFRLKDWLATCGARYLTLNGRNRHVARAKRLVDSVT